MVDLFQGRLKQSDPRRVYLLIQMICIWMTNVLSWGSRIWYKTKQKTHNTNKTRQNKQNHKIPKSTQQNKTHKKTNKQENTNQTSNITFMGKHYNLTWCDVTTVLLFAGLVICKDLFLYWFTVLVSICEPLAPWLFFEIFTTSSESTFSSLGFLWC